MRIKSIMYITGLALTVLSGTSVALAQQSTDITISSPANGAAVSRNFTLSGTSSRGGGSLQLKIDGLSYLPTDVRTNSGAITEGVNFGETADGAVNTPFSLAVDLNGPNVVSSGGTDRQPVGAGPHRLQVCQVLGPVAGCGAVVNVTVSDEATASAATLSPSPTPSPSASPLPAKTDGSSSQLIPILVAAVLGGLAGYGGYRFFARGK